MSEPGINEDIDWYDHIARETRYTKGVSSYCRKAGLNERKYRYWKSKLTQGKSPISISKLTNAFSTVKVSKEIKDNLPDPSWVARFVSEFLRTQQ